MNKSENYSEKQQKAINELYGIYKKFKQNKDTKHFSELFSTIDTSDDMHKKFVALKGACAEENNTTDDCDITSVVMPYYNTLQENELITNTNFDKSWFLEKCQPFDETKKLCDMDKYSFGQFLCNYADQFNENELPNNCSADSNKDESFSTEIKQVVQKYSLTDVDLNEFGYQFVNNCYKQGFWDFVKKEICNALDNLKEDYNKLFKKLKEQGKKTDDEVNYLRRTLARELFALECYRNSMSKKNISKDTNNIDISVLGLGLSKISRKAVFIIDIGQTDEPKLWIFDASIKSACDYKAINCVVYKKNDLEITGWKPAPTSNYVKTLTNLNKEKIVLFCKTVKSHYQFNYLDWNNEIKKEIFVNQFGFFHQLQQMNHDKQTLKEANECIKEQLKLKKDYNALTETERQTYEEVQDKNINEITILKDKLNTVESQIKKAKTKILDLQTENGRLIKDNNEKKAYIDSLEETNKKSNESIRNLHDKLNKIETSMVKTQQKLNEQTRVLKDYGAKDKVTEELNNDNSKKDKLIEELNNDNSKKDELIEKLNNDNSEKDELIARLKLDLEKTKKILLNHKKNEYQIEENEKLELLIANRDELDKNMSRLFLIRQDNTDIAASKFSLFYFFSLVFSWLSASCEKNVRQTRTIIDLNQKFYSLRRNLNDSNSQDAKNDADDILHSLDDFLPTLEGEFFDKYALTYIMMLNLNENKHDTSEIYRKLNQNNNNILNQNKETLKQLKKITKPNGDQKNKFIDTKSTNNNINNHIDLHRSSSSDSR